MNSGLVALAILSAHLIINSAAQAEELAKRTKEPRKVFIVARQLNIDGQTYIRTIDFSWRRPRSCTAADFQPQQQDLSHTRRRLDQNHWSSTLYYEKKSVSAAFLFLRAPDPSHGGGENERPIYRRR